MTENDIKGRQYFADGHYEQAEIYFRLAAHENPQDPLIAHNLGATLGKLDKISEAIDCYRHALALNPLFADAYINLGACLNEVNLAPQARQSFALARKIAPDNAAAILNEGLTALALGDYGAGWRDYGARWLLPAYGKFRRSFDVPVWQGENITGKTLLLYAEQGFGDTIQMARYAPLLAARGARIIIEAPPALVTLLQTLPGSPTIITKGEPLPAFDFHAAMMDVPALYGTQLDSIPADVPYLFADADRTNIYRQRLTSDNRTIGLCWAGRPSHENDAKRSLSLAQLLPLMQAQSVHWVSLQRMIPDCDAGDFAGSGISDWGTHFADFAETAAAIAALDLVITVDTSVAHLAGALGKQVWLMLPFYADWRWLIDRTDSPWYKLARLFRQPARGNWDSVIDDISTEISKLKL